MKNRLIALLLFLIAVGNYSCKKQGLQPEEKDAPPRKISSLGGDLSREQTLLSLLNSNPDIEYQWVHSIRNEDWGVITVLKISDQYFSRGSLPNLLAIEWQSKRIDYVIKTEAALAGFKANAAAYAEAADYFKDKLNPAISFAAPVISESTDMFTQAGRIIGETADRGYRGDLNYGTNGDVTGITPDLLDDSDDVLFSKMKDLMELTSMGDLQTAGYAFLEKFKTNTSNSSTFSHSILNSRINDHSTFITFLKKFAILLQLELARYKWKIEDVPRINIPTRPVFNGAINTFGGLQILINDTELTEIRLVKYEVSPTTGKWTAHVETTIYDHFGLDKNDALTYQDKHNGFAAWWILQHRRNKVPFITKVVLRHSISTAD